MRLEHARRRRRECDYYIAAAKNNLNRVCHRYLLTKRNDKSFYV